MKFNEKNYKKQFLSNFKTPAMLDEIKKDLTFTPQSLLKPITVFRLSVQMVLALMISFNLIKNRMMYVDLSTNPQRFTEMDILIILLSLLLITLAIIELVIRLSKNIRYKREKHL